MPPSFIQDPLFKKGLRVRKAVLGGGDVARRISSANQYTQMFEEFTTKAAWGLVWSRPGLSRRIRSFLNLGMLIALAQPQELRIHISAVRSVTASRATKSPRRFCTARCIAACRAPPPRGASCWRCLMKWMPKQNPQRNPQRNPLQSPQENRPPK